ncbi:acid phosphatase/Vanadium-dependent haloperoxidase [Microthyrium microscopicum]|uniref:Acid phosphatase/Vanadium-dependent haloperoxidase n=1 Tax=Microthyrium microscopicum TaxID=703497 RepID=A0A6A6U306_9PEZI|nr:acid phosphatase/Vanadium-dependent haloperoxidase [Microthyrium microscopicum]
MGLFNRNRHSAGTTTTTGNAGIPMTDTNHHHTTPTKAEHTHASRHQHTHTHGAKPSFGQWLKFTLLDLLTMLVMGMIGLGVYFADPAPSRSFPILFKDGEIVYPQFSYPLRKEIIPIWAAAMLAFFVPFVVFLIVQIRARSFWDFNNAVIGLLYSLISAAVFQVFLKWLIGGLRPHFLTVCQPDLAAVQGAGVGFQQIMFDRSICTGDQKQINDSLESFPSGHTTAAFAGFVFLYLYLNAKLKVFANYHPAMWKLIALYAPLLGAVLIAGALTIDEFHNWYDCLAGAIIGTVMAFSAYRMVYASVWDFRFNHIPLSRNTAFFYTDGQGEFNGFRDAIWTRKVGWGNKESGMATGAPFDATSGLGGGMGGSGGILGNHHHNHNNTNSASVNRRPDTTTESIMMVWDTITESIMMVWDTITEFIMMA